MDIPAIFLSGIILVVVLTVFWLLPIPLWLTARFADVHIDLLQLVFMRFRRVPPVLIVNAMVLAKKAGIAVERDLLEAHYLSGGNVERVVKSLIIADREDIELDFKTATAIDLAGRNVLEEVQQAASPKVIQKRSV